MKVLWIVLLSFFITDVAKADWLAAMQAYENQNYTVAQEQFSALIPLGNEDAIFNLGAMYFQGEGFAIDKIKAFAHFMLAVELGRPNTSGIVAQVQQQLNTEQQLAAAQYLMQLKQQIKVSPKVWQTESVTPVCSPKPIIRKEPKYPEKAAMNVQFGYSTVRFLIDENGKVALAKVIDAYPTEVFDRSSIAAIRQWQYEPTGRKHLGIVTIDYALSGVTNISMIKKHLEKKQLWQAAIMGAPQHQFALATLLKLLHSQSGSTFFIDSGMPLSSELDLAVFRESYFKVKANFDGFVGDAIVRITPDGTIVEQIEANFEPESQLLSLLGLKLQGKIETDVYRLSRESSDRSVYTAAYFKVPATYSPEFWQEKAARNGNKEAQRILAPFDKRWEQYLLEQQDPETMAWKGSQLVLDGEHEQGVKLLEAAIAADYKTAIELKKHIL